MRTRYVTLIWDQRPREFEQDKLDTAYLVWKDLIEPDDRSMHTIRLIKQKLHDEHAFALSDAIRYAIAVIRCGYDPVNTQVSSVKEYGLMDDG